MNILICASECAPFIKVGGISDVIESLPQVLQSNEIDARVVIPMYKKLLDEKVSGKFHSDIIFSKDIYYNNIKYNVSLHYATYKNFKIYFIENTDFISYSGVYYDPESMKSIEDETIRFAFFSKSIVDIFSEKDGPFKPDIFHCNDWHTGIIPQLLEDKYKFKIKEKPKSIITIHNLGYQGFSSLDVGRKLGLDINMDQTLKWDSEDDNLDFLLQGIVGADAITTVSPNYAREIQTKEYGEGLDSILRARSGKIYGILNGINNNMFNPETDILIHNKFNSTNFTEIKPKNKSALQKELDLDRSDKPIISIISRLAYQKGLDVISNMIFDIVEMGYQIIILGTGDKELENSLKAYNLNPKVSKNIKSLIYFSNEMAMKIYASSDMMLIPSRYEPCGLTQMICMRYGTIPIARATGGLEDSITQGHNGYKFKNLDKKEIISILSLAKEDYINKTKWNQLILNAMKTDNSWKKSSLEYLNLYKTL